MTEAYLKGMLHDAAERRYTYRISQKNEEFVEKLADLVRNLGSDAWVYEEGERGVFVLEFSKKAVENCEILSEEDKIEYVRGYFDAEGSVPKDPDVRFYIYFAQQDKEDLQEVKNFLEDLDINTGRLHRPSKNVRPHYWRFYVSADSHEKFAEEIGSEHPVKSQLLRAMRQSTPRCESG